MLLWYRAALHRWAALRHEVERLLQSARSEVAQNIQPELQSIDRKQWRIANRIGGSQILSQEFAETPAADAAVQLWQWTVEQRPALMRCVAPGAGTPLVLHYRTLEAGRLATGLWGVAGALAVTALAIFVWRMDMPRAVLARWPLALGLLAGAAWWLWLEPSILGAAVIAMCLLYLLRTTWRRYRRRHSLIVPLGPSSPA